MFSKDWLPEFSAIKENSEHLSKVDLSSSGWCVMVMELIDVVPCRSVPESQTRRVTLGRSRPKNGGIMQHSVRTQAL